jgi:hypothetical protein
MSIHTIYPGDAGESALARLGAGETPMPLAPCIALDNGERCIPQHHLQFSQTVETVSAVLGEIEALDDMLLFCGSDASGLYLQVGVIGPDTYDRAPERPQRLVYGRKWRIESYTPTSEVIQTALLAIKKACEHEVRELLVFHGAGGKRATPFSTHGDLPLMAHYPELVAGVAEAPQPELLQWLGALRFDGRAIRLVEMQVRRNGSVVLDLMLADGGEGRTPRYGFERTELTVVLPALERSALLHEIMGALILHSDRLVDEQFRYRGLARFSRALDPWRIAQLSIVTRTRGPAHEAFEPLRQQANYEVDRQRVPSLGAGRLAEQNRQRLLRAGPLGGYMPLEWLIEEALRAGA